MKSKLAFLVIFLYFLQICYGNENEHSNGIEIHWKKVDEPCQVCEEVVGNIISLRRSNGSRADMFHYLIDLCFNYTDYGMVPCWGMVDIKLDTALYIIDNRENLTAARFCSIHLQTSGCKDPDAETWSIPLPPLSSGVNTKISDDNVTTVAHILHLTDIHYDPQYKWNSDANCKEPLCCESGTPSTRNEAAGYWGDYRVCDSPWPLIGNLFYRLGGWHRRTIDWMYFTGDIVNHRSWATSVQKNSDSITEILKIFYTTFPDRMLYPILGNHEAHPADFFAPDSISDLNISTQWLYDLAAKEWLRWLPDTTVATIKKGGFYTVLVKPGFRIIGLNSNVCYVENIWLVYDDKDPYGQLQWLVDVLTEAEKNGEKVHILSHVPPGEVSCHRQWSHEFKRIVLRFSETITAQFNGHTHTDEFKLFFNSSSLEEVKGVAFNGGSLTTFVGSNPNYRIYEINNETMAVTNYEQYSFNLTVANNVPQIAPDWKKLYTIKGAYALPDLELETLGDFFWQMASNNSVNDLVEKYYRFMYRNSDLYPQEGCDEQCRKKLVCQIAATETDEAINC